MGADLQLTVDKFTFRVPADRSYTADGVWVQRVGDDDPVRVRLGVTDFVQQHSGDMTFVHTRPAGTRVLRGEEFAAIETVKVDVSLVAPVAGRVVEVNDALETAPEMVNQDPYGAGWLAVVEATNWAAERGALLEPEAYLAVMKQQATSEAEAR